MEKDDNDRPNLREVITIFTSKTKSFTTIHTNLKFDYEIFELMLVFQDDVYILFLYEKLMK